MKRYLAAGLCCLCLACGGGGGVNIDDVAEGAGPALNVSTDKSTTASLVHDTIMQANDLFETGASQATTTSGAKPLTELCSKGSFSIALGSTSVAGTNSTVSVSGDGSGQKESESAGRQDAHMQATFTNHTFTGTHSKVKLGLNGTANIDVDARVTEGLAALCGSTTTNATLAMTDHRTLQGSLSVSEGVGAAVVFDVTIDQTATMSGQSAQRTLKASGQATVKSNGATATCTVTADTTLDPDTDFDTAFNNLVITCE